MLIVTALRLSPTADEPTYIALGYGLFQQGKGAFPLLPQRGFTPLLIALEALPLYLANPSIPVTQLQGWPNNYAQYTGSFQAFIQPISQTLFLARLPIIWLTLVLAAVVYRWATDLAGKTAGVVALGVMLFDPLLLAHGGLSNSDAGTVALGTAGLYATWRLLRRPSALAALAAGLLLGLTLLAKASGLLWLAAAGLMILMSQIISTKRPRKGRMLLEAAIVVATSLVLLFAGYGFEWRKLSALGASVPVATHWENLLYLQGYR